MSGSSSPACSAAVSTERRCEARESLGRCSMGRPPRPSTSPVRRGVTPRSRADASAPSTWLASNLTRLRVRGCRLGFLNLAGAQLDDVRFEACEIDGIDARGSRLNAITFVDCSIAELNVTEARLTGVDLSGARLRSLIGVDNLRGAIISREQLMDLAPLLAGQLGIEIRPD